MPTIPQPAYPNNFRVDCPAAIAAGISKPVKRFCGRSQDIIHQVAVADVSELMVDPVATYFHVLDRSGLLSVKASLWVGNAKVSKFWRVSFVSLGENGVISCVFF